MKVEFKAGDLAKNPVLIDKSSRVKDVVSLMLNQGLDVVVVTDSGKPVGTVSYKDVLWSMIYRGVDLNDGVDVVINRNPPSVTLEADLNDILNVMTDNNEKYVLVFDEEKLSGVIVTDDLLDLFKHLIELSGVKGIKVGKR